MNTIVALPIVSAAPTAVPAMPAALEAAVMLATAPSASAAAPAASPIDRLYEERTALAARSRELKAAIEAATAALPWWARPGKQYLRGDGTWSGVTVPWPAIDDGRKPTQPHYMQNKRPGPIDIKKDFQTLVRTWPEHRDEIRRNCRDGMRRLVARIRAQREEEARVGLPAMHCKHDLLGERIGAIDDALENTPVQGGDIPQKAAAVLLIGSIYERRCDDLFGYGARAALEALLPCLRGQLHEHAEFVLANADTPLAEMPFWSVA